jgi:DNA-binding MarR family transcriptional regulator
MSRTKFPPLGDATEHGPRIGALLRLAWQRIRERIYSGVRNDGYGDLNPAHVALFRYEGLDGQRPTQLAESVQITKQSVNDLIRHLERCGYAECRPDPNDKRARLVRLTAMGRRLEAAIQKHARAAEKELERELGPVRFRELFTTLKKMNRLATDR